MPFTDATHLTAVLISMYIVMWPGGVQQEQNRSCTCSLRLPNTNITAAMEIAVAETVQKNRMNAEGI